MPTRRFRLKLDALDVRITPATLRVDDDLAQFPNAKYQTIQAAVNASLPGDTVLVAPGSYAEQVYIGAGHNGLTLRSQVPLAAVISLPASAPAVSAIVTIDYSTGVDVNGFTIAGPGAFSGQLYDGLEVNHRASVTVRNNLFRDIGNLTGGGDGDGGEGGADDPTGIAVYVGADGGGAAVIRNNTFLRYGQAGIVVDGPNSSATITGNTLIGAGPTAAVAQIGVQISQNGSAQVSNNLITGHDYTGAPGNPADPTDNPLTAVGVLVYQAGAVTVTRNQLLANQTGVYVQDQSNTVLIQRNTIAGSTLDGVNLDLARASTSVLNNSVSDSGRDGIHLQSNSYNNTVARNTVTGSGRYGIASVPTVYGADPAYDVVAPAGNVIVGNTVSGSGAFDLFALSVPGSQNGEAINDLWAGNTYGTKNRPGLR